MSHLPALTSDTFYQRQYQAKFQGCRSIMSELTALFMPKAALIKEDFPTPLYESEHNMRS